MTMHPLAVFLAIAFWAWVWGPLGAFVAVPLMVIATVIVAHLFPSEEINLPG
jgi:predicted PurR-regulated permease PerM